MHGTFSPCLSLPEMSTAPASVYRHFCSHGSGAAADTWWVGTRDTVKGTGSLSRITHPNMGRVGAGSLALRVDDKELLKEKRRSPA